MIELIENIWTVYEDTAFWLLLGLFAGGLVKACISADTMQRWLGGKGMKAVVKAALFGAPLPLCSCGVLPAAIAMRRSGASKEATVSFLISTPETSIDSVAVTYALMGPVMAIYRPLAALMSAMITGLMTSFVGDETPVSEMPVNTGCCSATTGCGSSQSAETSCCAGQNTEQPEPENPVLMVLRYAFAELLDDISTWLFIGIIVAGVMITVIPPGWLAQWGSGLLAMLVMLVVGIPMYICAVASTPIAAGLLLVGVSPGTVLVFLLVGPATNMASLILLKKELGMKVTMVYLAGIAVVSVLMGLLLDQLIVSQDWPVVAVLGEAQGMLPEFLVMASAVLLLILAVAPLRRFLIPALK